MSRTKGTIKSKLNITYFECNRKGHYVCPKLRKQEENQGKTINLKGDSSSKEDDPTIQKLPTTMSN